MLAVFTNIGACHVVQDDWIVRDQTPGTTHLGFRRIFCYDVNLG